VTLELDPTVRRLWTAALRSGRFAQGRDKLVSVDDEAGVTRHCCLGVLCVLAVEAGVEVTTALRYVVGRRGFRAFDGEENALPVAVQRWAGLTGSDAADPRVRHGEHGQVAALSYLNDRGVDFDAIADVIDGGSS
jgi:hypothetical protein